MSERNIVNEDELAKYFNESNGVLVVYFYATWCGPCKFADPKVQQFSQKYDINLAKVNVDDATALAAKYKATAMPTFILLADNIGNPVMSLQGTNPGKLEEMFAKAKKEYKK